MFSSLLSWEMGGGGFCFGFWGVGFLGGFFFLVLKKKIPLLSNRMLLPPPSLIQRAVFVSVSRLLL